MVRDRYQEAKADTPLNRHSMFDAYLGDETAIVGNDQRASHAISFQHEINERRPMTTTHGSGGSNLDTPSKIVLSSQKSGLDNINRASLKSLGVQAQV